MKEENVIILFLSIVILINLISIIVLLNLSFDLSGKIDILETENTELKWQLDQVDQMICNNDMED